METTNSIAGIPADTWDKIAKTANTTPAEIKSRYEALLAAGPNQQVDVSIGEKVTSASGVKIPFNISLFKIIGLTGYVEFNYTSSSDWQAQVHICLEVAGSSVWCTDYALSNDHASITFNPNVGITKATLTLSITLPNFCFNISGKACYWAFKWHCDDFNKTLFCFK